MDCVVWRAFRAFFFNALLVFSVTFQVKDAIAAQTAGSFVPTSGRMTAQRESQAAVLLQNGLVLIAGGQVLVPCCASNAGSSTALSSAELFNPATGMFSPTGNMTTARALPTAVTLPNGEVLVTDGKSADLYNPSSAGFSATASPSFSNAPPVEVVLLNTGNVLVTDGKSAELYEPASGTFTATGSPLTSRNPGGGFTLSLLGNGKVLLAGGCCASGGGDLAEAELYDSSTGAFTATGSMTQARESAVAAVIGGSSAQAGEVMITGGNAPTPPPGGPFLTVPGTDLYNPSTGQFTFISAGPDDFIAQPQGFSAFGFGATATTMPNGQVLVAGGVQTNDEGGNYTFSAIYDPASSTFLQGGVMVPTRFRAQHTATLLKSGKVLIAGGDNGFFANRPGCCSTLGNADLFDSSLVGTASDAHFVLPVEGPESGSLTVLGATNSDVQWVNFYVDGNYFSSSPPHQFTFDTTSLSDGPHTLMAIGLTNSPSRTDLGSDSLVMNVANHHVTIPSPLTGIPSTGCQPLSVQHDTSVSWVDNYLDGVYQNSSANSCIDTTKVPNGVHTISTTGFASNGSVAGKDSVIVHVANAASQDHAFIVSPASGSGVSATIPVLATTESGVSWINIYIDGNYLASSPPFVFNIDTSKLSNGKHTISLRGFNSSGQVATDQIVVNVLN